MILISHRGNINGKEKNENSPILINQRLNEKFNVEIDVWFENNQFYLGHDEPEYKIDINYLMTNNLWIHCKNSNALSEISKYKNINYFYHNNDDYTLTSKGYIWVFPGKELINNSIVVLPEITEYNNEELKKCYGICSDNIQNYKHLIK